MSHSAAQPDKRSARISPPAFLWDYDIDEAAFKAILSGTRVLGRLDTAWAARRLLEYASYEDIVRIMGFRMLAAGWPSWRDGIRSTMRRQGLDFLVEWLAENRKDLIA